MCCRTRWQCYIRFPYRQFLYHQPSKNQRLWLCFARQQTKARNPDYVGGPAKAGFGEKLEKKNLSSMSSSKSWGPQAAFLNQHYDNSWCSVGSPGDPGCGRSRGSICHHNRQETGGATEDLHQTMLCCNITIKPCATAQAGTPLVKMWYW